MCLVPRRFTAFVHWLKTDFFNFLVCGCRYSILSLECCILLLLRYSHAADNNSAWRNLGLKYEIKCRICSWWIKFRWIAHCHKKLLKFCTVVCKYLSRGFTVATCQYCYLFKKLEGQLSQRKKSGSFTKILSKLGSEFFRLYSIFNPPATSAAIPQRCLTC